MDEFLDEFLAEAGDHLSTAEGIVHGLDLGVSPDPERIDSCFRSLHSLKGSAAFLDLDGISRMAHAGEQVLEALRGGALHLVPSVKDALLTTMAFLRRDLNQLTGRQDTIRLDKPERDHLAELEALLTRHRRPRSTGAPDADDRGSTGDHGAVGNPVTTTAQDGTAITGLVGELISLSPTDQPAIARIVTALLELVARQPWAAAAAATVRQMTLMAKELAKPGGLGQARFNRLLDHAGELARLVHEPTAQAMDDAGGAMTEAAPVTAAIVQQPVERRGSAPGTESPATDTHREFVLESLDLLAAAEEISLKGLLDADGMNLVFRSFHSIKGMAAYLNQPAIEQLAHGIESQLMPLRDGARPCSEADRGYILTSVDQLRAAVEGREMRSLAEEEPVVGGATPPPFTKPVANRTNGGDSDQRLGDLLVAQGVARADIERAEQAKLGSERLGETLIRIGLASPKQIEQALNQQQQVRSAGDGYTRVAIARLEDLMNLVGELLIGQAIIAHDATLQQDTRLGREISRQSRTLRELQTLTLSMRMVPLKNTFQRMTRAVHDTARRLAKEIELVVTGEDTEIDRSLAETLSDPLLHMVRNGADHGIEAAEVRIARGKPARGTLRLEASSAGDSVIIRLGDDGGGMDPERLRAKAVEKGLISADRQLSREEAFQLIFLPGFSTAAQVTGISGRGVGMDVVNRAVHQAGGSIEITSEIGVGSIFTITLPLTTAIMEGMLLTSGGQQYLLPITAIVEALRPAVGEVQTILGQGKVVQSRGLTLPIIHLGEAFGLPDAVREPSESILLVVESPKGGYALQVDQILGQRQVVIKPLGSLDHHPGVSGTAILGDGRVGLILDPMRLL